MAATYLPHGRPFRAVDIGLDHFPYAGIQSPLDGGFCIGQQPLVIEMGMGVDEHGVETFK